jgi:hypothetical protein
MKFLLKALGIGLIVAGVKRIRDDIKEEKRRRNTICLFDGEISKEEFYVMVKRGRKGLRRITNLYAEGTMVYGTVRSQSGISEWCFQIDFNDYGKLTGKYWLSTDNNDSSIPKLVADRIAQQISNYPVWKDDLFCDKHYHEEVKEEQYDWTKVYCPYCGKQNDNEDARFCMYCGGRFHV